MKKVLNAALYKALEGAFGRPDVYRQGTTAAYRVDATTSLDAAGDSFGTDVKGGNATWLFVRSADEKNCGCPTFQGR